MWTPLSKPDVRRRVWFALEEDPSKPRTTHKRGATERTPQHRRRDQSRPALNLNLCHLATMLRPLGRAYAGPRTQRTGPCLGVRPRTTPRRLGSRAAQNDARDANISCPLFRFRSILFLLCSPVGAAGAAGDSGGEQGWRGLRDWRGALLPRPLPFALICDVLVFSCRAALERRCSGRTTAANRCVRAAANRGSRISSIHRLSFFFHFCSSKLSSHYERHANCNISRWRLIPRAISIKGVARPALPRHAHSK